MIFFVYLYVISVIIFGICAVIRAIHATILIKKSSDSDTHNQPPHAKSKIT